MKHKSMPRQEMKLTSRAWSGMGLFSDVCSDWGLRVSSTLFRPFFCEKELRGGLLPVRILQPIFSSIFLR